MRLPAIVVAVLALGLSSGMPATAGAVTERLGTVEKQKAATACQSLIVKLTDKILLGKLKALDACGNSALACVQTKAAKAGCLPKAGQACAKKLAAFGKNVAKAKEKILAAKTCATQLGLEELLGLSGLGLEALAEPCRTDFQLNICGAIEPLAECLVRSPDRAAGVLYGQARPRMQELLGRLAAPTLPEIDGLVPAQDCQGACPLASPSSKAIEQCGKAVTKATLALVKSVEAPFAACAAKVFTCVQTKAGDPACLAKATAGCDKSAAKVAAAFDGFGSAIDEKCGAVNPGDLGSPSGLNLPALAGSCAPTPSDAEELATCLQQRTACAVASVVQGAVGRTADFEESGRLGTLAAAVANECPDAVAATAIAGHRAGVFGSIVKFLKGVRRSKTGTAGKIIGGGRPPSTTNPRGSLVKVKGPNAGFGAIRKVPFTYRLGARARALAAVDPPSLIVTVRRDDDTVSDHFEIPLEPAPEDGSDADIDDEVELTYQDAFPFCFFTLDFAIKFGEEVTAYKSVPQSLGTSSGVSFRTGAGPEGGGIRAIVTDPTNPDTIYAGTDIAGVFKSTDGGLTWTAINDGIAVPAIFSLAIDPTSPNVLYAGTADSFFKTTDGGESWKLANTGLGLGPATKIAINPATPSTLYAAVVGPGVFRSTDGAGTWKSATTGISEQIIQDLVIDPSTPSTLYAATISGAFKTTNGGGNWSPINTGLTSTFVRKLAIDPATPSVLYAGLLTNVFKSVDGGAHWNPTGAGLPSFPSIASLIVDPTSPTRVYAGTVLHGVFVTTTAGGGWAPANTGLSDGTVQALAIDVEDPATLYAGMAGAGGGVFITGNAGASWLPSNSGLVATIVNDVAVDPTTPTTIYAATSVDGLFRSDDSGASWERVDTGANVIESYLTVAVAAGPLTTIYVGGPGVRRSSDGGANWTGGATGLAGATTALAIDPANGNTAYAGTSQGVFKTTNGGTSWTPASAGLNANGVGTLVIDAAGTLYAGTGGGVFKSVNGATGWAPVNTGLTDLAVRSLALDPLAVDTLYVGTASRVFKTTNGGTSWTLANGGLPIAAFGAVGTDPTTPGTVYATATKRLFKTTNGGDSWTEVAGDLPVTITSLAVDPTTPDRVYVGSPGHGVLVVP